MDKMKQIMNMIRIKKLEFVNTSLPRCFLLAINQNEPEYALRLISKFENLNLTLGLNLSVNEKKNLKKINIYIFYILDYSFK